MPEEKAQGRALGGGSPKVALGGGGETRKRTLGGAVREVGADLGAAWGAGSCVFQETEWSAAWNHVEDGQPVPGCLWAWWGVGTGSQRVRGSRW